MERAPNIWQAALASEVDTNPAGGGPPDGAGKRKVEQLVLQYGFLIVAVIVFLSEVGVPTGMPVELIVLLAGAFTIHSVPELALAIAIVTAADVLGALALYLASRVGGGRLLGRVLRRFGGRGQATIERWRTRLGGYDVAVVAVGRSLPVVRMYFSIGAGLLNIRARKFLIGAIPGAAIWAGTPLVLGFAFRDNVDRVARNYSSLSHWLFLIMPLFSLAVAAAWWVRRGQSRWARVQRGRTALGLTVAAVAGVVLVREMSGDSDAFARGLVALGSPFGRSWPLLLAGLTAAILNLALTDLRRSMHKAERARDLAPGVAQEVTTTVVWLTMVAVVAALILGIVASGYPLL